MNGVDPDRLTLRRFIDVACAILVEEWARYTDLFKALDHVDAIGLPAGERVPEAEKIDNQQSMDVLMATLGGVKGAPVR